MLLVLYSLIFLAVGLQYRALISLERQAGKQVRWARTVYYATAGAAIASLFYRVLPILEI